MTTDTRLTDADLDRMELGVVVRDPTHPDDVLALVEEVRRLRAGERAWERAFSATADENVALRAVAAAARRAADQRIAIRPDNDELRHALYDVAQALAALDAERGDD